MSFFWNSPKDNDNSTPENENPSESFHEDVTPESEFSSPDGEHEPLPTDDGQDNTPQGPLFVIPENPFGPLGLVIAIVAAIGVFRLMRRKDNSKYSH